MGKFLFTEVRTPTGDDVSASIRFAAIKIDDIFQTKMDQRFRVMVAANIVAQAQGSKVESITFEDRQPFLVSWNQSDRTQAHQDFCDLISDGIDDHIGLGKPYVMEVDTDFLYRLNDEWPQFSSLGIDMDGYALTWVLMFKHSVWEAYVSELGAFMSLDQLLGDSYESN
jgi:hypothetical protein